LNLEALSFTLIPTTFWWTRVSSRSDLCVCVWPDSRFCINDVRWRYLACRFTLRLSRTCFRVNVRMFLGSVCSHCLKKIPVKSEKPAATLKLNICIPKMSNSQPKIHGRLKCCCSGRCNLEWGLCIVSVCVNSTVWRCGVCNRTIVAESYRAMFVVVDSIWLHMENSLLRHCMDVVLRFADST